MVLTFHDSGTIFDHKMHGLDKEKHEGYLVQFSIGRLIEMGIEHSLGKKDGEKLTLKLDNGHSKNLTKDSGAQNGEEVSSGRLVNEIDKLNVDDKADSFSHVQPLSPEESSHSSADYASATESETSEQNDFAVSKFGQSEQVEYTQEEKVPDQKGAALEGDCERVAKGRPLRVPTKASRKVYPDVHLEEVDMSSASAPDVLRVARKRGSPSVSSPSLDLPVRRSKRMKNNKKHDAKTRDSPEPVDLSISRRSGDSTAMNPTVATRTRSQSRSCPLPKPVSSGDEFQEKIPIPVPLDLSEKPAYSSQADDAGMAAAVMKNGKNHLDPSKKTSVSQSSDVLHHDKRENAESPVCFSKSHKCIKARWYKKWQDQEEEREEENQEKSGVSNKDKVEQSEEEGSRENMEENCEMEEGKDEDNLSIESDQKNGEKGCERDAGSLNCLVSDSQTVSGKENFNSEKGEKPCMDILDLQMMRSLQNISANSQVARNMNVSRVLHLGQQNIFKYSDFVELIIEKSLGAPGAQDKKAKPLQKARIKNLDCSSDSSDDGGNKTMENRLHLRSLTYGETDASQNAYGSEELTLSEMISDLDLPKVDSAATRNLCTFVPGNFVSVGQSFKPASRCLSPAPSSYESDDDDDDDDDDFGEEEEDRNYTFGSESGINDNSD